MELQRGLCVDVVVVTRTGILYMVVRTTRLAAPYTLNPARWRPDSSSVWRKLHVSTYAPSPNPPYQQRRQHCQHCQQPRGTAASEGRESLWTLPPPPSSDAHTTPSCTGARNRGWLGLSAQRVMRLRHSKQR
jgi:hypothetical protein